MFHGKFHRQKFPCIFHLNSLFCIKPYRPKPEYTQLTGGRNESDAGRSDLNYYSRGFIFVPHFKYLTKPFHREELIARVGVGLRIIELQREVEPKNALLKGLALADALTSLPNRRAIEDWAARQLNGAARYGFSFWVALAELDHFKTVNDIHGHDAGDTVLKAFSEILKTNSRRSDICGRMGGEEFLFVLTHATEQDAKSVIDRVR